MLCIRLFADIHQKTKDVFVWSATSAAEDVYHIAQWKWTLYYFGGHIIIIIIKDEEIIVVFSPKTTKTRYKVKKKQNCEIRRV